jgi:hypothetical protein
VFSFLLWQSVAEAGGRALLPKLVIVLLLKKNRRSMRRLHEVWLLEGFPNFDAYLGSFFNHAFLAMHAQTLMFIYFRNRGQLHARPQKDPAL